MDSLPNVVIPIDASEAVECAVGRVLEGRDVALTAADGGRRVLGALADRLGAARCRALLATSEHPGGLGLSGLMAQVTRQSDLAAQDDGAIEQGFRVLTEVDAACDRIVLLVADAETLQRATLRYLQFVLRAGPNLQFVVAGRAGWMDGIAAEDAGVLRERLLCKPVLVIADAVPLEVAAPLAPLIAARVNPVRLAAVSVRRRRASVAVALGLGSAVLVGLGIWVGRQTAPAALERTASTAVPVPAPPPVDRPVPAHAVLQVSPPAPVLEAPSPPIPAPSSGPVPTISAPPHVGSLELPPLSRPKPASRVPARTRPELPRSEPRPPREPPPAPYYELPAPNRAPYIGTFTTDGYGVRTFRYGP